MASLQKYSVGGRIYYRIVESRRVNGKPRPIPIMHIGSAEELVNRLLSSSGAAGPSRIRSYQHGDVAALKAMADRLAIAPMIDRHVKGSYQKLSVGTALLLAAINRAVEPCSKRAWAEWAEGTSIHRFFDVKPEQLTSQFFWDRMDEVSVPNLEAIEDELTKKVISEFDFKLDTLFYDTTNFFTFIASDNERSALTKRGHSKQKRFDLRQFSLGLLVSRDGQIPLCSHTYEGNVVDCKSFPESLTRIRRRLEHVAIALEDITLVYDKGNNSKKNQALVDGGECPLHYVASLVPSQHPDLLGMPASDYQTATVDYLSGMKVLRCKRTIWGSERTLVLFISEKLRRGQIRGLQQHLDKAVIQLQQWQQCLVKPRSGPKSDDNASKKVDTILSAQHLKDVLKIEYNPRRSGGDRLSWHIDAEALEHLHQEVFGKRILMTDRHDWSDEDIIRAYNGQSRVEDTFRRIKDPDHLAVRPQYHWTDQKIRVHVFICLLALMLTRLLERESSRLGHTAVSSRLLDLLGTIRLAMVLSPSTKKGGRPRCDWQLEDTDQDTRALFSKLVPAEQPFVYTPLNA